MILFVLESHRELHFGGRVDESSQWIAGAGGGISAGGGVFERAGLVVDPLSIGTFQQETFNLVGGVQRVAFLLVQILGEALQYAANVSGVRRSALVDDFAEH